MIYPNDQYIITIMKAGDCFQPTKVDVILIFSY